METFIEPKSAWTIPIEEHSFKGHKNDFLCQECHRPRAMHFRYPFHPGESLHFVSMDPAARYGRHPRFTPKGKVSAKDKQFESDIDVSPRRRESVERVRQFERVQLSKLIERLDSLHSVRHFGH